ncbi:MAG: hypothetical protein ACLSVD_05385 [Eggerthellaceae bacterium]
MLEASDASAELVWDDLPLFKGSTGIPATSAALPDVRHYRLGARLREAGRPRRREFENRMGVLCDPQASGGLLVAVADEADAFARAFEAAAGRPPALIGHVRDGAAGEISMK